MRKIILILTFVSLRLAIDSIGINEQIAYWTSFCLFIGSIFLYWSGLHILWGIGMAYISLVIMIAVDGFATHSETIAIITDISIIIVLSIIMFIYVTNYKSHTIR